MYFFSYFREFAANYNPYEWRYNGGQLLTRVLKNDICHTSLAEMTPEKCRGLEIFPPVKFYPINFDNWEYFTNVSFTEFVLRKIRDSSIVHLYNHFWHHTIIKKSKYFKRTAYEFIAEENCQRVFRATGEHLVFIKT